MGEIINVKEIVEKRKDKIKIEVGALKEQGIFPKLAVIMANDEDSSRVYVSKKRKMCEELGILEEEYIFDEDISNELLLKLVDKLNQDPSITGILVQLPLFPHLNEKKILEKISPTKDVDGFHPINVGKLSQGSYTTVSCTPRGILNIIKEIEPSIEGKHVVIVGRSNIVGKPMAALALNENATVTICHSKTKNLEKYTKMADILIVAVGRPHLITAEMVKEGSIVIDVGINRIDGKLVGDVDTNGVANVAKYITPVPGGVGVTTVCSLMENLVELSKKVEV